MSIKRLPRSSFAFLGNIGAAIAGGAVILTMLFVVFEVTSRYVFNRPTSWSMESNEYLLVITVWCSIAYTQRYRGHIKVDILYQHFSKRLAAILELVFSALAIVICAVVIWQGIVVASSWFASDMRSSSMLRFPISFIFVFIPFGFFLYALQLLDDFWECVGILRNRAGQETHHERITVERT